MSFTSLALSVDWFYPLSFLLGALVGLSELLSRYTWTIGNVFRTGEGRAYLLLNGIASVFVYFAAIQWDLFHLEGKSELWRVLITSTLAMALMRSSFINLQVGHKQVAAGFASILEIFMHRAERVLDQKLVQERWTRVASIVKGLNYKTTKSYLSVVSQIALRSLSAQENDKLLLDLDKVDKLEVEDEIKMQFFAMGIVEKTGLDLFISLAETAKSKLANENIQAANDIAGKFKRLAEARKSLA